MDIKTLSTFDYEGNVIMSVGGGNFSEPAGSMIVIVPSGKKIKCFDMMGGRPQPIFEDIPKTEFDLIKEQNALLQNQLEQTTKVINILLMK